MHPLASIWTGALISLAGTATLVWVLYRWLKASDEPARLAGKWVLSLAVLGGTALIEMGPAGLGGGPQSGALDPFLIVGTAAFCGILLTIIWGSQLGEWLARPLAGLFDGGAQEVPAGPLYAIAEAKIKRGQYADAMEEIRRQLARWPGDLRGTLLLAEVQAVYLKDLPAACATVEAYLGQAGRNTGDAACALSQLADWHLNLAGDVDSARATLERIVQALPDSEPAFLAQQRIAHLATPEMVADKRSPHRVPLGVYEPRVGLLERGSLVPPPPEDPGLVAAEYVNRLEQFPEDNEAREKLAVIYARHYQRLDLAAEQLERLIAQKHAPARQVVRWLNLLADLQIQCAGDVAAARATLGRIEDRFPRSAAAETALKRGAQLGLELHARTQSQPIKLGAARQPVPGSEGSAV